MIDTDAAMPPMTWRKSSRSGGGNQCVEVAQVAATAMSASRSISKAHSTS